MSRNKTDKRDARNMAKVLWICKEKITEAILLAGATFQKQVELLITIRGITPLVSLAFLADLGDINRESRKLTRTILTQTLFQVADAAPTRRLQFRRFFDDLKERRGAGRARIALIRKLCGIKLQGDEVHKLPAADPYRGTAFFAIKPGQLDLVGKQAEGSVAVKTVQAPALVVAQPVQPVLPGYLTLHRDFRSGSIVPGGGFFSSPLYYDNIRTIGSTHEIRNIYFVSVHSSSIVGLGQG